MACEAILSLMSSLVGAAHRDDLRNFGGLGSLVDLSKLVMYNVVCLKPDLLLLICYY